VEEVRKIISVYYQMASFDNLPPTIHVSFDEKVQIKEFDNSDKKDRVVLCYAKDLANEELDSLRENGKILRWSAHLANLDFSQLDFDFLLVDLREKDARIQLGKQDLAPYHVVAFTRWFQREDSYIDELHAHCISSLPKRWVSKQDFLSQLTSPKISSPNALKSFLRLLLACWK
jgi:hypothetical protein